MLSSCAAGKGAWGDAAGPGMFRLFRLGRREGGGVPRSFQVAR